MVTVLSASMANAEGWTDLNGTRTIEARLVGLWGDSAVLQLQDGRKVTVNLENLNATSRIQAQKLGGEKTKTRLTLINELRGQATEAAAPAPTPLPTPRAAPSYAPPTPGATCIAQLQWEQDQVKAGHVRASFDVLPMSYRSDIGNLVKQAVNKVDPLAWQSLVGGIHKAGDLIVTRQRWLFSHPRLKAMQPSTQDTVQSILLNLGGLLRTGFDPAVVDIQKLQSMPFDQWLAERSDAIAPYLYELFSTPGMSLPTESYELVSEKDGVANIKVGFGSTSVTTSYTEVDGFWVLTEMATNWAEQVAEKTKSLNDMPNGTLLSGGMSTMIAAATGSMMDPMLQARNEKDFHASLEPLFMTVGPMLAQAPALLGARPRGGQYGQGGMGSDYDGMSDYEMEMEMEMDMEEDMNMDMDMSQ